MLVATITTQRSGSKLMNACFWAGTEIRSLGELFFPGSDHLESFHSFLSGRTLAAAITRGAEEFLDEYFSTLLRSFGRVHFDLMFNQLEIPCTSWSRFQAPFIYGYLRSRNAFIISLERPPRECFLSSEYLNISNTAHYYVGPASSEPWSKPLIALDVSKYLTYRNYVEKNRRQLHEYMAGYSNFHVLSYSELARAARLPSWLTARLAEAGQAQGFPIEAEKIQIGAASLSRTPVNYRQVFSNVDALD